MITTNEISTEMKKWRHNKKINKPENCLICGKFTRFKYYNILSCNSCKQFFRRIVINQIQYFCLLDGKCDLKKDKCRGCRLDKCLLLGMDPSRVNMLTENKQRVFYSLEKRRKELMMNESKKLNGFENNKYCQELELECNQILHLTKILNAHRQIRERCFDLPDFYLNKFSSIEEVLDGQENILSLADCFSPYFDHSSNDEILQLQREIIENGYGKLHPKIRKHHIVLHLLVVGILKAMPFFNKLMPKDKEILIRELGHQINALTSAYYSMEIGQMSVTGPRGLSTMNIFENKYKEVPRILQMTKIVFVNPIEAFCRIPMLSREEFALLIAIYVSNPAISGLSSHASELLYNEQCKYSQLLLKNCQQQAGNALKGAQRYAECLQLIECAFQAVRYMGFILTYVEMFLSRRHYLDDIPADKFVIKCLIKDDA